MKSLWSKEIETDDIVAPSHILQEQAGHFSNAMKNVVTAEVDLHSNNNTYFYLGFDIVAPMIENYRTRLFNVRHDISFYPLEIDVWGSLREEIEQKVQLTNFENHVDDEGDIVVKCRDRKEFEKALELLFQADATVTLVKSLKALSRTTRMQVEDDIPF